MPLTAGQAREGGSTGGAVTLKVPNGLFAIDCSAAAGASILDGGSPGTGEARVTLTGCMLADAPDCVAASVGQAAGMIVPRADTKLMVDEYGHLFERYEADAEALTVLIISGESRARENTYPSAGGARPRGNSLMAPRAAPAFHEASDRFESG